VNLRGEVVLGHDAALARLLGEIIDFRETRGLVVQARETETLVPRDAVFALGGAADRHAETLSPYISASTLPPLTTVKMCTSPLHSPQGRAMQKSCSISDSEDFHLPAGKSE
jgi:hypothetical protein